MKANSFLAHDYKTLWVKSLYSVPMYLFITKGLGVLSGNLRVLRPMVPETSFAF